CRDTCNFAIINYIYIYIGILYIKCPGHVLDITKFMSMDGTVLDVPSMDIVPSHYQHCLKLPGDLSACRSGISILAYRKKFFWFFFFRESHWFFFFQEIFEFFFLRIPIFPWFSFPRIPIFPWFHYPTVLGYFFYTS